MTQIEPVEPKKDEDLTRRIQDFWTRNVNAERIMGRPVTANARGDAAYFIEIETQRYRSHRHLKPWIQSLLPGRSVLEIGSGIGIDAYTMATHGLDVFAVDLTQVAVRTAKIRFQRDNVPGYFAVSNAESLPFADESFDYVYSFGVLHHAASTEATIKEVYRVLRTGGEARIMLYHRHSLNELVHRLTGVPFEDKREVCPVVRRFTLAETKDLFHEFRDVHLRLEYLFGEGYGMLFRIMPRPIYDFLSRRLGWHILINALK